MRALQIVLLVGLVGCGRFGFSQQENEEQADAGHNPDGASPDDPDAAIGNPLIACDSPERFQVGAASVDELSAVATSTGFALFTFTTGGTLSGWAYEWRSTGLEPTAQNIVIGSDLTATYGAEATTNGIVLAAVTAAGGTRIYPLTNSLEARGAATTIPDPIGTAPIAANGQGDQLALITIDPSGDADLQPLSSLGALAGTSVTVAPGADNPGSVSIHPASSGFIVSWSAAAPSPNALQLALADPINGVTAGPVTANNTTFDPLRPQIHWAPDANVYMVTWYEKNVTGDDDIWIQILDESLAPVTPATIIANFSVRPKISTDGLNFWVTWRNYNDNQLESARVSPAGDVTLVPVSSSGGRPERWSMIERSGQAVLAWAETGGSGPDLWLAALCE